VENSVYESPAHVTGKQIEHMRQELGDGLVLRESTLDDVQAIGEFFAEQFGDSDERAEWVINWIADLFGGSHPTVSPSDCTIVEDTNTGQIASACGFVPQTWRYEDIEFGVGQPELVATHPDYRRRGLVRKQFEVLHRWSEERGHLVTAINGIRNYYRQFEYEMTIDMGGGRSGSMRSVPKLGEDTTEAFRIRPATEADLSFFTEMYRQHTSRLLVSCVRDEEVWQFDLFGGRKHAICMPQIIERENGERVGALGVRQWGRPEFDPLTIYLYELVQGVSWLEVTPSVLRWIKSECAVNAALDTETDEAKKIDREHYYHFQVPKNHPVFEAIPEKLHEGQTPYAWFMRVPDLPRFIHHIKPVLERRLAQSVACGHSGELNISFYRDGLRIKLENGRLAEVESWQPTVDDQGNAFFPDLTFLHLVFGHRTVDEINAIYPDCAAQGNEAAILRAMFPKRPSLVWQVL
jgi:hypothetical protein